ncbi:uncharacterized protein BO95DRAFT_503096, partial [Aspergillus brunneoviolaceus CBS 621.78]
LASVHQDLIEGHGGAASVAVGRPSGGHVGVVVAAGAVLAEGDAAGGGTAGDLTAGPGVAVLVDLVAGAGVVGDGLLVEGSRAVVAGPQVDGDVLGAGQGAGGGEEGGGEGLGEHSFSLIGLDGGEVG